MTDATCPLPDCGKPLYQNKKYCASHFMKAYRYGDPQYVPTRRDALDLTGQLFGELTAVKALGDSKWECLCSCGRSTVTRVGDLRRGTALTCGERPTHPRKLVITYAGAHDRVTAAKGRAADHACVDCSADAQHWSYDHADPNEMHESDGRYVLPYSLNPDHYDPRCIKCHRRFDRNRVA